MTSHVCSCSHYKVTQCILSELVLADSMNATYTLLSQKYVYLFALFHVSIAFKQAVTARSLIFGVQLREFEYELR